MIVRIEEKKREINVCLIAQQTYQFVYNVKQKEFTKAFYVYKKYDITYFEPVSIDSIDMLLVFRASKAIKSYLESKKDKKL